MSLPKSSGSGNLTGRLSASFRGSSSPLSEALARDIAECSDDDINDNVIEEGVAGGSDHYGNLSNTMYRRASGVAYGTARPVFDHRSTDEPAMTALERKQSRNAERSLLRDNHILPPKHHRHSQGIISRLYRRLFSTKLPTDEEQVVSARQSETAPLLDGRRGSDAGSATDTDSDDLEQQWIDAVASGRIQTTWQREMKTVITYCIPLITTFALQYSINVASIFAVGRIGKMELGAVSCKLHSIL